jgi:hypothetical protein
MIYGFQKVILICGIFDANWIKTWFVKGKKMKTVRTYL